MMWFQKPPLGTPLNWEHPFNKDLALHLAMNEGHGDVVRDLSMNGNHGTLNNFAFPPNAASGWNPGQTGVGLNFDGTDDYVDCGNTTLIAEGLTVSVIINTTTVTTHHQILAAGFDYSTFKGIRLGYITGNFRIYWGDGASMQFIGCSSPTIGEYTFITAVYNDDGKVKLYKNGVVQADIKNYTPIVYSSANKYIGCADGTQQFFNGSIDQPRIQSRAWSAKEVKDYYINPWQVYLDEEGM